MKKCPAEAGHSAVWKWMRIQTAQSFERQGNRPSALGHYGPGRRIFADRRLADRILADRSLANRSRRRRRRLSARQIGSGGSTQHRKGCGRCGEHLQHDVAPLFAPQLGPSGALGPNGKMSEQRQSGNEKGCAVICFPEICCIKSTSLNPDANVPAGLWSDFELRGSGVFYVGQNMIPQGVECGENSSLRSSIVIDTQLGGEADFIIYEMRDEIGRGVTASHRDVKK